MTGPMEAHDDILSLYAEGPARLEAAIQGLSGADLDLAPGPEAWSICAIVHHVADGDELWKPCIKAALGNPEGWFTLQWYWDKRQMEWSQRWHYASRPLETSLALLRANRHEILELLSLTPRAWEAAILLRATDEPDERVTVGWVLDMQARHVVTHCNRIQAIRQAHGV